MCSVPEFCQRVLSEAVKRCHATFGHSAQALFTQHRSKLSHLESSVRARSVTYGLSLSSRSSLVSMPLNRRANIVLSCMIRVNPTVSPGTATCTHARTSTESIDRNSSRFLFKKECGNSQKTSARPCKMLPPIHFSPLPCSDLGQGVAISTTARGI